MQNNDAICGNSLLVVITDKGKGSEILNFVMTLGIRGATAFHARGMATNKLLRFLELDEMHKDMIMIALPTRYEQEIVHKLTARCHFDRPDKGIIFTLGLSGVYGSRHFNQESSQTSVSINDSPFQAIMTIVDKDRTESILDFVEENGLPCVTVIDAHGSEDKSNVILNLVIEPEKDIFLMLTTRNQAHRLAGLLTDHLNLKTVNSGVLAIFDLNQLVGIKLTLPEAPEMEAPGKKPDNPGYSLIIAIVENDKDEAVIHSAESAGATGGTIIHARGTHPYHGKSFLFGIEPEREVVMIIAEDDKIQAICRRINTDLHLDQPGNGIIVVAPLYDTAGLIPSE